MKKCIVRKHKSYYQNGKRVSEARQEKYRKLAIPPAYGNVCVSPNPKAKVQATATDAKGTVHYYYSDAHKRKARSVRKNRARNIRPEKIDRFTEQVLKGGAMDKEWDGALALRMKRAVCPNPDVNSCALDQLPSDYEPLRKDECAVCHAVVSDLFGLVRTSRERPQSSKSDAYYRLVAQMSNVCEELPMRHALRTADRPGVVELCEDLWDEHETVLSRLALERGEAFAASLCADELEVCDESTPHEALFAHDPGQEAWIKQEL